MRLFDPICVGWLPQLSPSSYIILGQTEIIEASEALGADRLRDFGVVIDVGGGRGKFVSSQLMSTITSSRAAASAYYLPWRRQRMSMVEMARLQGLTVDA